MKGMELKTNTVVIMDGTNYDNVRYITDMLRTWSPITVDDPKVYRVNKDRDSMIAVKVQMYEADLAKVNERIEQRFPGLCIFNPPMAV